MRLLVVEDDVKMASVLKRGLEREGYAVDIAATGEDALWAGCEFPYDAVVLDAMIPVPDGFDVCRRLREAGRWMPVMMLTARDSVDDRVRGLDAGADDYLPKPFSFAELFARLRALLRREPGERPVVLQAGDLSLDPARRTVARGGTRIELTPREFTLLDYFMRNPGRVLTRTMIAERVWDYSFDTSTNVIDVYVNYLRKKIDADREPKLLHTVRGVGYAFRPRP